MLTKVAVGDNVEDADDMDEDVCDVDEDADRYCF